MTDQRFTAPEILASSGRSFMVATLKSTMRILLTNAGSIAFCRGSSIEKRPLERPVCAGDLSGGLRQRRRRTQEIAHLDPDAPRYSARAD